MSCTSESCAIPREHSSSSLGAPARAGSTAVGAGGGGGGGEGSQTFLAASRAVVGTYKPATAACVGAAMASFSPVVDSIYARNGGYAADQCCQLDGC